MPLTGWTDSPEERHERDQVANNIRLWTKKVDCYKHPERLNQYPPEERAILEDEVRKFKIVMEQRKQRFPGPSLSEEEIRRRRDARQEEATALLNRVRTGLRDGSMIVRGHEIVEIGTIHTLPARS